MDVLPQLRREGGAMTEETALLRAIHCDLTAVCGTLVKEIPLAQFGAPRKPE